MLRQRHAGLSDQRRQERERAVLPEGTDGAPRGHGRRLSQHPEAERAAQGTRQHHNQNGRPNAAPIDGRALSNRTGTSTWVAMAQQPQALRLLE